MNRALVLALVLTLGGAPASGRGPKAVWEPVGLNGGGAMFSPAVSPADGRRMMLHCDMSAAYVSRDGGRNWTMVHRGQLSSNTRCRPAFHPTDPEVVFSPNGWNGRQLAMSTDGGTTWTERAVLPDPLRGEIAIDPADPGRMLVGTMNGAFLSTDGGRSFSRCEGVAGEAVGFRFDAGDRRRIFAATAEGIWRSDDGGRAWAPKVAGLAGRPVRSLAGAFRGKGRKAEAVLWATVPSRLDDGRIAGGLYSSGDLGETWEPAMGKGLNADTAAFDGWAMGPIAQCHQVVAADAAPDRVWLFQSNTGIPPPHHASVYRSDDRGKTWRPTFQADPRWPPANAEPTYFEVEDRQHYQFVPSGMVQCATDPDRILMVENHVYATEDGGRTWLAGSARSAPGGGFAQNGLVVTTTWNVYRDPFRPKRTYVCYTDIGFAISDDGGGTFRWWPQKGRAPWRNTCYELAVDPETPGRIWGAFSNVHDIPNDNVISERHRSTGAGGICLSEDFAESWTPLGGGLPEAPATSVVLDPKSPKGRRVLYAGFFGPGLFRSEDGGRTWTPRNDGLGHPENRRVCRVALHRDGTLFALVTARRVGGAFRPEGVGLHRSRDGGRTWENLTAGPGLFWPKDFTVDPEDSRVVWLGAADARGDGKGGLWRTGDGGRTWVRAAREGPEHFGAYLHPTRNGWVYMTLTEGAPGAGLFLSKDGGKSFRPMEGLPFRNAQRVAFLPGDEGRIWVTTFGGSVWRGPEDE